MKNGGTNKYLIRVRKSIAEIARTNPNTLIVIISDGKTDRQIQGIKDIAAEYGMKTKVESHADTLNVIASSMKQ